MVNRVYLAGPIQHAPDDGKNWRNSIKEDFSSVNWEDPLDNYDFSLDKYIWSEQASDEDYDDPEKEVVTAANIVEEDKEAIDKSDAVLVGWRTDISTCGTPMEILYAWQEDTPVIVWNRFSSPEPELSPWLQYHSEWIVNERALAVSIIETL